MRVALYIVGGLMLLGLLVFLGSLFAAWRSQRKWNRMGIGERLEELSRRNDRRKRDDDSYLYTENRRRKP